MFWKVEVLLFPKSTISIYEICFPAVCMAVSEKPVKNTVFHVKSSLLGIEVTKSALDLPDQCFSEQSAPILIDAQIFSDIIIFAPEV